MPESLALKYRPRSFDDLVGQRSVQVILKQMVTKDMVPSALLFDGSRGTGKTTTARILAAALNCENTPAPCGHCPSCKSVYNGSSPDVIEVDAASNGLVDHIRTLRQQILYSVGGRYRVVILDEAHSLSAAAFNALLKTLEEPPPATVFVLLTTEPSRIPDTVLSRCMPFTFRRIAIKDIVERLSYITKQEEMSTQPDLLTLIAERADGGMRDAIMTLDQVGRIGIQNAEQYRDLIGEQNYAPALIQQLVNGELSAAFETVTEALSVTGEPAHIVNSLIAFLRDILVLHAGGSLYLQGTDLQTRRRLRDKVSQGKAVAALRVLWELKTKTKFDDNLRLNIDLAIVMLSDVLAPPMKPAVAAIPDQHRKLTLAEMAAMR